MFTPIFYRNQIFFAIDLKIKRLYIFSLSVLALTDPDEVPSGYSRVVLYDPVNQRIIELDPVDSALPTITLPHHKIHEGKSFRAVVFDADVDIAAPKYVRITTPDTAERVHLEVFVSGSGQFRWEFFQDPTINAAGTVIPVFNVDHNQQGLITTGVLVKEDCTTQLPLSDGTRKNIGFSGGEKKRVAGESGSRKEDILKPATEYLVKVTADADNTLISVVAEWYKE